MGTAVRLLNTYIADSYVCHIHSHKAALKIKQTMRKLSKFGDSKITFMDAATLNIRMRIYVVIKPYLNMQNLSK